MVVYGGGFIELQIDELQGLIASKDAKVQEYLRHCETAWLIIVADGQYISSNAELPPEVRQHAYKSQFERVLFYDRFSQRVVPLIVA